MDASCAPVQVSTAPFQAASLHSPVMELSARFNVWPLSYGSLPLAGQETANGYALGGAVWVVDDILPGSVGLAAHYLNTLPLLVHDAPVESGARHSPLGKRQSHVACL